MRFAPVLACLFLVIFVDAGCGNASTTDDDDCDRLRDHAVDLSLAAARDIGGADLPDAVRAAHREQLRTAVAASYAGRCDALRKKEIECALVAASLDDMAACTGGAR
jgi:hypothetical protein